MFFFFFKQKTAYEMRISDWSSDVCSSDLLAAQQRIGCGLVDLAALHQDRLGLVDDRAFGEGVFRLVEFALEARKGLKAPDVKVDHRFRSEEHTSELPSLMSISYAFFCLKKKKPPVYTPVTDSTCFIA